MEAESERGWRIVWSCNCLSLSACLAEGAGTLAEAFSLGETQAVKQFGWAQPGMWWKWQTSLAWLGGEHGSFLQRCSCFACCFSAGELPGPGRMAALPWSLSQPCRCPLSSCSCRALAAWCIPVLSCRWVGGPTAETGAHVAAGQSQPLGGSEPSDALVLLFPTFVFADCFWSIFCVLLLAYCEGFLQVLQTSCMARLAKQGTSLLAAVRVPVQAFGRQLGLLKGKSKEYKRGASLALHQEQQNLRSASVRSCISCVCLLLCLYTCVSCVLISYVYLFISRRQRLYKDQEVLSKNPWLHKPLWYIT